MDSKIADCLKLVGVIALYSIGLAFYVSQSLAWRDYDAAAAYLCITSLLAFIPCLFIFSYQMLKPTLIVLALTTLALLVFICVITKYDDEQKNVVMMIPFMGAVFSAFYVWCRTRERKRTEKEN